jgi:hypothetical protein
MTRRAAALLATAAPGALAAAEDANARWNFLRTNLSVFPGTEKIFKSDDDRRRHRRLERVVLP